MISRHLLFSSKSLWKVGAQRLETTSKSECVPSDFSPCQLAPGSFYRLVYMNCCDDTVRCGGMFTFNIHLPTFIWPKFYTTKSLFNQHYLYLLYKWIVLPCLLTLMCSEEDSKMHKRACDQQEMQQHSYVELPCPVAGKHLEVGVHSHWIPYLHAKTVFKCS